MNTIISKLTNSVISLAVLANVSPLASISPFWQNTIIPNLEGEIAATSLVAKTPLNEGTKRVTVFLTAYSSTPDQTDDTPFVTAAGTNVRDGIVAANFLPLHSKIKIPAIFGEKVFVVEDRMARRYQDRVDIWFPDRASAKMFGLKTAEIVVLN